MRASGEIAADIGHPDHQQNQHQRGKSPDRIEAHQHRGHQRRRRIAKPERDPAAPLRASSATATTPSASNGERQIDPAECKPAAASDQRGNADDHRAVRPRRRRSSAIRRTGRSRPERRGRARTSRRHRPAAMATGISTSAASTRVTRFREPLLGRRRPAAPCPALTPVTIRFSRPDRQNGAHAGRIRRSRLPARPCRNPASGSARTRIRCRPPATSGSSTAAARRWCG